MERVFELQLELELELELQVVDKAMSSKGGDLIAEVLFYSNR